LKPASGTGRVVGFLALAGIEFFAGDFTAAAGNCIHRLRLVEEV
jgi:hypothetical protein